MKKLKIISIVLGIIVVILIIVGVIFSTIYEDKVKTYIIERINNSVNTKIDVKEVNFSVFKKFPYASLEFKGVTAKEVIKKEKKGNLFSAQSIYLQFNIIDILNENYTIKKVQVEDGMVNIKIDKFGNDNYHFWKKAKTNNQLSIALKNLTFKHVNFYILNDYKGVDMDVEAVGLSLSGNFSKNNFTLKTAANLQINQLNENGKSIIKNKNILVNTSLAVNQLTKVYQIKKGELAVENLKFILTGQIKNKKVGVDLNIQSEGKDLEIEELFSLFPAKQKEVLSAYQTYGKITYSSSVKGEFSAKKSPSFTSNFSIKNGQITEKSSKQSLTNLNVTGSFSNGKSNNNNTLVLNLKDLQANFGAGHLSGNYMITNFSKPYIEFDAKANIDIETAKDFFKVDSLELASGVLDINLKYSGYIKSLNNIKASELRKLNAHGTAKLTNASFKLIKNPKVLKNINGNFKFNNNDVQIDTLNFVINESKFELDGKFKNLLAYLFVKNEYLLVKANFHTNKLMLDELLSKNEHGVEENKYTINLPENIVVNFKTKIDTFQFRKFKATHFKGNILLEDKVLTATDVTFNAMNGMVSGNIALDDSKTNKILITSKVVTKNIDVYELFYQFENFGQQQIVAENLKGKTNTSVEFASVFDKQLQVDKNQIYVQADVNIANGELINYKPILAMSKFVKVEELEAIKFNKLSTHVEIKDQTVIIPKTAINSSALDLSLSGTHTFDNKIDYRFKLLLDDVLWKKAKKRKKENSEFGYIEDDGLGRTTLFLHMTGTVSNYKISYDTKGLKESFLEDLKKEKHNLKTILNDEFGWFKKDSTLKDDAPKDDGFQIEWEEDQPESTSQKTKDKFQSSKTKKRKKKKGLGKFIDKIAQPDAKEFEEDSDF